MLGSAVLGPATGAVPGAVPGATLLVGVVVVLAVAEAMLIEAPGCC